ncbi:DNA/RNA nuclease SfsA [Anaeromonas gelatinilytica]|uniref:DNA/RNA nuclease SfsA n=1 Tax=Anaeromonas gelatinilytica TaxID=2683194 RepID=UPI0020788EC1|nr:DNA/RNA nuclease SfsA [Anaeromonas gelatinilytica]
MVNIKGNLVEGKFISRLNRFVAEISIDGNIYFSHVPNTGRMKELLIPGARIIVRKVNNLNRKTEFDLLMVYHNNILVSIDSSMPNKILYDALINKEISFFRDYMEVNKEVKYKNSRFDLSLKGKTNTLIEAKCVTFVDNGTAKFPDAPTTRGTKHVLELIEATKENFNAAIIFIIQRNDAEIFSPNHQMDPKFSEALKLADQYNVKIKAIKCHVNNKNIKLWKEVKVKL